MRNQVKFNELSQEELKELVAFFQVSDWVDEDDYSFTDIASDLFHAIFMKVWNSSGGGDWYYNDESTNDMTIGQIINCAVGATVDINKCEDQNIVDVYDDFDLESFSACLAELHSKFESDYLVEDGKITY